jgi:hypothetical protein
MLQQNEKNDRHRSIVNSTITTTIPTIYLKKSRSNSWSSSNEKISNLNRNESTVCDDNDYYYFDHDKESLLDNNNSLSHYRQSFMIKNSNIENWNRYNDLLNKLLLLPAYRKAASTLIDEFIKLETYLLDEFKSYEKEEKDMNYQSCQEIVDFLNRNLQVYF